MKNTLILVEKLPWNVYRFKGDVAVHCEFRSTKRLWDKAVHEVCSIEGTDAPSSPSASDLTMHGDTMLKSYYDVNWLIPIHYKPKFYKQNSESGDHETCIVKNLCMVLWVRWLGHFVT